MRSRGSYRIPVGSNGVTIKTKNVEILIEDSDDDNIKELNEESEVKQISNKKTKCDQNHKNPITIESDEDFEADFEMIENDLNTSRSSDIMLIEEKTAKKELSQKCGRCLQTVPTKDYDFNRLTSADFYINPRIHPSVISMELKDKTRFDCFNESISRNKELFVDKSVLVIGSGTGLLGLLVAKVRAKNVIIMDKTGILEIIQAVIDKNQFRLANKRTKFFLISHLMDETSVLPNGLQKVDIIVSDWTNHSLFYKSMIATFIKARDKWLKKGGLIFPDSARLYLASGHDSIHKHTAKDKRNSNSLYIKRIEYWDQNVYGFDMTALRPQVLLEPSHEYVNKSQVITNEYILKSFDLHHLSLQDINFCLPFHLTAIKDHYLQTFVLFFEVIFGKTQSFPIMYSTRPTAYKHVFRPTVFFVESAKQVTLFKNDKIDGHFNYDLSQDLNQMSITIDFEVKNEYSEVKEKLFYTTKGLS